jgi:hypothetical protein
MTSRTPAILDPAVRPEVQLAHGFLLYGAAFRAA